MCVWQEVSPLTSGRLSHSSEPLNGGASLTGTDSPPISPSAEFDDVVKVFLCSFPPFFWTEEGWWNDSTVALNSAFSQVQ